MLLASYSIVTEISSIVAFFGVLFFLCISILFFRSKPLALILFFILFSILFSIWVAGIVWGEGILSPIFDVYLTVGKAHKDTLYYISISNMIKTYGIPSTGIDGLHYLAYHYGSNWIFARLSILLDVPLRIFYQMVYPIIFIPFFFYSFLMFVLRLSEARETHFFSCSKHRNDYLFGFVMLLVFFGVLPVYWGHKIAPAFGFHLFMLSESYTVGLCFFFLFMTVTLSCAKWFWPNWSSLSKNIAGPVFLVVVMPLFIGCLGFLKVSLMYLAFVISFYFFLRFHLFKKLIFLFAFLVIALCFALVKHCVQNVRQTDSSYVPFLKLIEPFWLPAFILFYFFWPIVYIGITLWKKNIYSFSHLYRSLKNKQLIDVELLIFVSVAGMIPGIVLPIGANAIFFQEFQYFLGAAFVLAGIQHSNPNTPEMSLDCK